MGCFMKVSKIVEKRTNKRDALGFLLFVFLLPYVCACLWGHVGEDIKEVCVDKEQDKTVQAGAGYYVEVAMEWGTWELEAEEYLIYRLAEIMQEDYEIEALKAQAVLLRTELVQSYKIQDVTRLRVEDTGISRFYYGNGEEEPDQYEKAVRETQGLYLCYQGQPIQACYFPVSNGQTRDAGQIWHTDNCPYLAGAACEQDRAYREWSSMVTIDRHTYIERIRSVTGDSYTEETIWNGGQFVYDEAGYVTEVLYTQEGEKAEVDGETFRRIFGLHSASFSIEKNEQQIVFHVTGIGHGFGMSQYGANCLALNGEDYGSILKYFFTGTELAKFE